MSVFPSIEFFVLTSLVAGNSFSEDTCADGRTVIVHLFNWKWTDVAAECERFLSVKGFCGVQVSPPNEHRTVTRPNRPWWERYQPASFLLESRSGTSEEFTDMVTRCNNVGVRIYVDAIINHMLRGNAGRGTGSGGSMYDARALSFPAVPFSHDDFNCCSCRRCSTTSCTIERYSDATQVRNCRLENLLDLNLGLENVRRTVAAYLNNLTVIGVAGFRLDACKHMWPGDIAAIQAMMTNLNTEWFPHGTKPFVYNEVIDLGGETISARQYLRLGRVTEFKYCKEIGAAFRRRYSLNNLRTIGESWGFLPSKKALVFVDNHDNQRGHGGGGGSILTFYDARPYKMATVFTLAHPYGLTRIMSSYRWEGGPHHGSWLGPPHNEDMTIKDVPINPDGSCGDDWICEHRWSQIFNMVKFRNIVHGEPLLNWWDNGSNQIAFGRGSKGFIAINNEASRDMNVVLQTGLPAGRYCDVLSDDDSSCDVVNVDEDGFASVIIGCQSQHPMIAIHVGSEVPVPSEPLETPGNHTAILVHFDSQPGQDLFLRGGLSHDRTHGCTQNASTSACTVPLVHRTQGTGNHYDKYNAWKVGDTMLDWYGAEQGQGSWQGHSSSGTPMLWTTNQQGHAGYQPLNRFGAGYWFLFAGIDCGTTDEGWFEVKAFVSNLSDNAGWEVDIQQGPCNGDGAKHAPFTSSNHVARCGFINVFYFNSNACIIQRF